MTINRKGFLNGSAVCGEVKAQENSSHKMVRAVPGCLPSSTPLEFSIVPLLKSVVGKVQSAALYFFAYCPLPTDREPYNTNILIPNPVRHLRLNLTLVSCHISIDVQSNFFGLVPKVGSKQSATPYFAYCPLPIANLSKTSQLGK